MIERLFVRQINENHWQWRKQLADGSWDDEIHAGTLELLAELLPSISTPVCLVVPGAKVVARNVSVDGTEKKHLAKLLPFEMEEEIIDPVEDLHFCFGQVENDRVNLFYMHNDEFSELLEEIELVSKEVLNVLPEFALLNLAEGAGTIVLDGELVIAKFGEGLGFAVEINIAPMILASLAEDLNISDSELNLVAESEEALSILRSCLPESWLQDATISIKESEGFYWDCIDASALTNSLNLRSGGFARQLPFARWWRVWQKSAYVAAAAFVLSLIVNFAAYLDAKSEGKNIREQIQTVYLQAVPNGRKGDEENRLENILKNQGGASLGEPSNLVPMLTGLTKAMTQQEDIQVSNFRYSGEQRELQVNIEVKGLSELGRFRELLAETGLESGSPRTSRQGEIYQANLKLKEKQ
ncbi:MAG: general secretion pathway protein GspL [Agarilytica sp.]